MERRTLITLGAISISIFIYQSGLFSSFSNQFSGDRVGFFPADSNNPNAIIDVNIVGDVGKGVGEGLGTGMGRGERAGVGKGVGRPVPLTTVSPFATGSSSKLNVSDNPVWLHSNPTPWLGNGFLRKEAPSVFANRGTLSGQSLDNEAHDAQVKYFWGMTEGIVLEIGGLNGQLYSVSKEFLGAKWHRILMEGSPKWWSEAKTLSADATYIGGAACGLETGVHYVFQGDHVDGSSNGIFEFMAESFAKYFYAPIYDLAMKNGVYTPSAVDWTQAAKSNIRFTPVPCVSLAAVFAHLLVKKINFFILDTEGAELAILRTVDFSAVQFDIIVVETDPVFRAVGYAQEVTNFLKQWNYVFEYTAGRNHWYKHKDFRPSAQP